MKVGLTITNYCGAKCFTCVNHLVRPIKIMKPEWLETILAKLNGHVTHLFVNSVGDFLHLPDCEKYIEIINRFYEKTGIRLSITTNCAWPVLNRNKIKNINASVIVCSFNSHPSRYKQLLGMDFTHVYSNILWVIETFGVVEIHVLKHCLNEIKDEELIRLFRQKKEVPIRISEKVENQCLGHTINDRMKYCDYVEGITIEPDGYVKACPHDWFSTTVYGNLLDEPLEAILGKRNINKEKMGRGEFIATICKYCNYPDGARIQYI